ncbi:MAG TPA: TlpA disulfide reductase family protein [Pyrinomonadaceae bacterium]|nr:TlpA disulfide reductase family protein [Pyrinomonadaceae bacterium]
MKKILFILLVVLVPVSVSAQAWVPAPPIVLKDLRGRNVRLADFKGKVVLVNFWATWCPPCRAEIPDLVKWQRQYKRKGLQVIGVTYPPTNRREVQKFGRQMKMNYPVWLGSKATKALFDPGETLPFTVIIDREGNVRATIEGILLPEEFDEKVRPLAGAIKFCSRDCLDQSRPSLTLVLNGLVLHSNNNRSH